MHISTKLEDLQNAASQGDWQQVANLDQAFRQELESELSAVQSSTNQEMKLQASQDLSRALNCYRELIQTLNEQQKQIGGKVRELRVGRQAAKAYRPMP